MFKSLLRFVNSTPITSPNTPITTLKACTSIPLSAFSSSTVNDKPTVTFYHNTNSTLSHHLAKKLNYYQNKFHVEYKINQVPSFDDYRFLHLQCLQMHPNNGTIFQKIYGALHANLHELEMLEEGDYASKVEGVEFATPLIIDYSNSLLAMNDEDLDRIMANYTTCGIQNLKDVHDDSKPNYYDHDLTNKYGQRVVHPHIAEYADLF
ncbi:hypothetical protein QCA50_019910 [Cerrena zonata]|uniref:Uncharacterized protein n=1 Tax=Cerrena zonata TaxID=2478898 RepID=A0AAW0FIS4_9APHY